VAEAKNEAFSCIVYCIPYLWLVNFDENLFSEG
jgi:hypothetical protein